MNSFDKINSITKFSNNLFNNLSPETISSISNAMKVAVPALNIINNNIYGLNTNFGSAISDIINNDLYKNINNKLLASFYNTIDSDFYKSFNAALKKTSSQMLDFINSDTYKNFYTNLNYFTPNLDIVTTDVYKNINLNEIKSIKHIIKKTVNEISDKDVYNDKDVEKVTELSSYALQMTLTSNCPKSVKKNLLMDFFRGIWKFMGIQQLAFLLTIVIFVYQNTVLNNAQQKITINQTINEIIIIERGNIDINLRGITTNNAKLYMKPNTKSQTIFTLDRGDIIEVLKIHKKWVYVRLYKTDIKGWVLKKNTKGPKFKKKDSLTIL